MGKRQNDSSTEKDTKHKECILSAYNSLASIKRRLEEINHLKREFINNADGYKACCHDISNMLSALMASPYLQGARISSGTLQNKTVGQVRGAFFKKDNQPSHQLNEIRDLDDVTPQNLWDYFLENGGFVSQCETLIKEAIKERAEVAAAIEDALSRQEISMPEASADTEKHHQNIIAQIAEQLAINTDRIVAMCKLLPRPTKEQFQSVMMAIFGMEAAMFQAAISSLLQKNVLLETTQFYLIEDQSFAVQAVANFQKHEDIRSVYHKLQTIGAA